MSVRNSAPGFWNTRGGIMHLKKPSKLCYSYAKNVAVYTKHFQLKVPEITCICFFSFFTLNLDCIIPIC